MTRKFNRNSLKPKYVFIWDVEQILTYIKGLLHNTLAP